jgi:hypothetical protein
MTINTDDLRKKTERMIANYQRNDDMSWTDRELAESFILLLNMIDDLNERLIQIEYPGYYEAEE